VASNQPQLALAFLDRHSIALKKVCKLRNGSEQMWPERGDVGSESKAGMTPLGWCYRRDCGQH
jgi:hypothetical protein